MSSKRNYLTIAELQEFADITVTDDTEANDQISQAEELIDQYVGYQIKAIQTEYKGLATGGSSTTIKLKTSHQNTFEKNYFKLCVVEIIGGTNEGDRKICSSSTKEGVLTTEAFTSAIDTTSYYKIWQLGKFPRQRDATSDTNESVITWYKSIPVNVRKAVASQVEYRINVGEGVFTTNKINIKSESIGDYSYTTGGNGEMSKIDDLIAPKAKLLLRGIRNIKGVLNAT